MWRNNIIAFSSFACCFFSFFSFFFLLNPNNNISTTDSLSIDILNRTCKKCAEERSTISYNFCTTSLQTIPISHVTNVHGLAIIGMELALVNATNTISSINKMLSSGTLNPFALACLENCLELYADAIIALIDGSAVFLTEHYSVADARVSAAMEVSTTCEESFTKKKGQISPLTKENKNLFQLSDIALCIIHMISVTLRSKILF